MLGIAERACCGENDPANVLFHVPLRCTQHAANTHTSLMPQVGRWFEINNFIGLATMVVCIPLGWYYARTKQVRNMLQYRTGLHSMAQRGTGQHSAAQGPMALRSITQHSTAQGSSTVYALIHAVVALADSRDIMLCTTPTPTFFARRSRSTSCA